MVDRYVLELLLSRITQHNFEATLARGAYDDDLNYPASAVSPLGALLRSDYRHKLDALRALLERGADPNLMMYCGRTACVPLAWAIAGKHYDCLELLLQYGARDAEWLTVGDCGPDARCQAILEKYRMHFTPCVRTTPPGCQPPVPPLYYPSLHSAEKALPRAVASGDAEAVKRILSAVPGNRLWSFVKCHLAAAFTAPNYPALDAMLSVLRAKKCEWTVDCKILERRMPEELARLLSAHGYSGKYITVDPGPEVELWQLRALHEWGHNLPGPCRYTRKATVLIDMMREWPTSWIQCALDFPKQYRITDASRNNALHLAVAYGSVQTVDALCRPGNVDAPFAPGDYERMTRDRAYESPPESDYDDYDEYEQRNCLNKTPLEIACHVRRDPTIVSALLANGADPEIMRCDYDELNGDVLYALSRYMDFSDEERALYRSVACLPPRGERIKGAN